MTDLAHITNYLCEAIDTTAANIENISPNIDQACSKLTETLLSDSKIIICGNGLSNPIGSILSTSGFKSGKVSAILQSDDIDIQIDSQSVARVIEIQLLIVNSLCHQLEATLFGGTD